MSERSEPLRVVIAGGGVAGLEAALALGELAGDRVAVTLLTAEPEFVYRPMRVQEPFGYAPARHYPLEEIARDAHAQLVLGRLRWLDVDRRVMHADDAGELAYDALLLALGARHHPRFKHVVTIDDARLDEQLHGLIQDVEGGYVRRLAFLIPEPMPWPLPVYELALMTAARAYDANQQLEVTIVTPEDAPLALFGTTVSNAVAELLQERRIETITSAHAEVPAPGRITVHPWDRTVQADRIVALPQLSGPSAPGLPDQAPDGFIPVSPLGEVRGAQRVFAAGDATSFPVKHGGIAAQQADVAAGSIAALAGADVEPAPFEPVIRGVLLGARRPLEISAHITGGHGASSQVRELQPGEPVTKIHARYLGPYLEAWDRAARTG